MPIPTRPDEGEEIATDWGQQVHDDTFSPKGARLQGPNSAIGTSEEQLGLDTGLDDPGGWLDAANDRAVVPTAADGLYAVMVRGRSIDSTALTRILMYVNDAETSRAQQEGEGGSAVPLLIAEIRPFVAGDEIVFKAKRIGSGDDPDVRITEAAFVRIGREWGA